MEIQAKFLGIREQNFKSKEGEDVQFYRLWIWTEATSEALELPISKNAVAAATADGVKFGDEIVLHPELRDDKLKVLQW